LDGDIARLQERRVRIPRKIAKRRQQFIMVPFDWYERLAGASGSTYAVALYLLYLRWKERGSEIRLPNGMLKNDGVSRFAKWRALTELERRGLIAIERRAKKSPVVKIMT
jgi:hypothetical protein